MNTAIEDLGSRNDSHSNSTEKDLEDSLCWSLDNVAVVTHDALPEPVVDDFDPFTPSNWMFFPGAEIKVSTLTRYQILLFRDNNQKKNFLIYIFLNLFFTSHNII